MDCNDIYQIDREVVHLNSLNLTLSAFMVDSLDANITPSALALQFYVKA